MEAGDWAPTGEQSPAVFTLLCVVKLGGDGMFSVVFNHVLTSKNKRRWEETSDMIPCLQRGQPHAHFLLNHVLRMVSFSFSTSCTSIADCCPVIPVVQMHFEKKREDINLLEK